MNLKNEFILILLIIFISICIQTIHAESINQMENITSNDNRALIDTSSDTLKNDMQYDNQNLTNNDTAVNKSNTSVNKDASTINYLVKNKEKYDNIVKKSSKKDRTFKLGKYKLTISKTQYKKFLYVKFMEKYVKSGRNITLLEKIFKIKTDNFKGFIGGGVLILVFPYCCVVKKTNKFITQKIGIIKDHKNKQIYFKNYKKAKKFYKNHHFAYKIKYDKKHKRYCVNVDVPIYGKILTKKARVYIELEYSYNEYQITTYTKYNYKYNPICTVFIKGNSLYKSCKNIHKLNKSKTKEIF